jgi:ABC-2 type transport system ATP-binding protein
MGRIEATGLTKHYGDKLAVDNLSFTVEPGVVTGFLGPNGAGKSTTMRLMLGLDHGAGQTLFDGKPYVELDRPLTHVGVVLDAKAVHPTRTARNHLRMLAASNHLPTHRVDAVLELVGLSSVADHKPGKFSLGMGQRLGLAAALLGDPHVLILDEPANGLDPQGIRWLRDFLSGFARRGRAVFVSSHLLNEMALMADHLVVIGKGRAIANGPVAEFISASGGAWVVARSPEPEKLVAALAERGLDATAAADGSATVPGDDIATVGETAFAAGVVLHELRVHRPSLEEAFMSATEGAEEFVADITGEKS